MKKRFFSGSEAAAYGAKLARVEVVSAYPISPNTGVISTLSELVSSGELDAEMVNVEGEHSAATKIVSLDSVLAAFVELFGEKFSPDQVEMNCKTIEETYNEVAKC